MKQRNIKYKTIKNGHFITVIVLLIVCILNACQPTPESAIVQNKNDIIDVIESLPNATPIHNTGLNESDTESKPLEDRVIGHWQDEMQVNQCAITINADIVAPIENGAFPIVKVHSYYFTDNDLHQLIDTLYDADAVVNNYSSASIETMQERLLYSKKLLEELYAGKHPEDDLRPIEDQIEDCQLQIEELEEKIMQANDENEPKLDVSFQRVTEVSTQAQFIGKHNKKDYILSVGNMEDVGSSCVFYYQGLLETQPLGSLPDTDEKTLLGSYELAEASLASLGINDYILYEKIPVKIQLMGNDKSTNYAYQYLFVRSYVGAIPPGLIDHAPQGLSTDDTTMQYGRRGLQESIRIIADGTEVYWVQWDYPYVVDTVIKNGITIMDKDSAIQAIIMQFSHAVIGSKDTHLFVTQLQLNGVYMSMKDEPDSFLVIPAWDAIGYQTLSDGHSYIASEEHPLSFLTINAIDGSVFDRGIGY